MTSLPYLNDIPIFFGFYNLNSKGYKLKGTLPSKVITFYGGVETC